MRKIQQKLKISMLKTGLQSTGTMEMFSLEEKSKSKHKFSGTKVCRAKEIREYLINPKIEKKIFGQSAN